MREADEVAAMLRLKSLGWGVRRIVAEFGCSPMTLRRYVATGGWTGYRAPRRTKALDGMEEWPAERFRRHRGNAVVVRQDPAHEVMPRVHMVASLLKRWVIGTHQGGIQHQHLDYYLDEFTFRFNRRRSQARGLFFHRPAQQAVAVPPAPYQTIVHPHPDVLG
jgi:hypothetical protein